jgi:hypothetical protein
MPVAPDVTQLTFCPNGSSMVHELVEIQPGLQPF